MIEVESMEFDGDDIWLNGDLISRSNYTGKWNAFLDNDAGGEFETLEQAVAYCLEQSHD